MSDKEQAKTDVEPSVRESRAVRQQSDPREARPIAPPVSQATSVRSTIN